MLRIARGTPVLYGTQRKGKTMKSGSASGWEREWATDLVDGVWFLALWTADRPWLGLRLLLRCDPHEQALLMSDEGAMTAVVGR